MDSLLSMPHFHNGGMEKGLTQHVRRELFVYFLFFFLSLNSMCTDLKRKKEEKKTFFRHFTQEGPVASFSVSYILLLLLVGFSKVHQEAHNLK